MDCGSHSNLTKVKPHPPLGFLVISGHANSLNLLKYNKSEDIYCGQTRVFDTAFSDRLGYVKFQSRRHYKLDTRTDSGRKRIASTHSSTRIVEEFRSRNSISCFRLQPIISKLLYGCILMSSKCQLISLLHWNLCEDVIRLLLYSRIMSFYSIIS